MNKKRVLLVGLEAQEVEAIKKKLKADYLIISYDMLPLVKLQEGVLLAESPSIEGKFLEIDKVIFHGIFQDDFDFITLLALWRGPCLPNANAMMDFRKRIPGLVKALQVSRFGGIKRGMTIGVQEVYSKKEAVAKWGVWHCGEDKSKFIGSWTSTETSVVEEFIEGEAIRIMIIGEKYWQIRLAGESWLKSIHNDGAGEMEVDMELLEDSRNIAQNCNIQMVGVDYIIGRNGDKYLLEVNHIPNVTVFSDINIFFINYAIKWIES